MNVGGRLKLSDFVIQNLVIHIALSLKRIGERNFHIKQLDSWSMDEYRKKAEVEKILKRVYHSAGLPNFQKEEVDYNSTLETKGKCSANKCENEDVSANQKQYCSVLEAK